MALQIVILSIFGLAIAQIIAASKRNKIRKYFKMNNLSHILVCENVAMRAVLENQIDRSSYQNLEVVTIDQNASPDESRASEMFKNSVKRAGIMRLPCMLHYDGHEISGKFYDVK